MFISRQNRQPHSLFLSEPKYQTLVARQHDTDSGLCPGTKMREKIAILLFYLGCCPFPLTQTKANDESNTDLKGDQPAHVRAAIGGSVTLSCTFIYVGCTNETRLGKFYTRKHWEKMNDAENVECRPQVSKQGRLYCNFSSTISNIHPANETVYYCEVWIPRSKGSVTVKGGGTEVLLYSEGSSIRIQPPSQLVSGREAVLNCEVSGFYPRNVSVLWFHSGAPVARGSVQDDFTRGHDGTFSLCSRYRFRAATADHAAECRCQVSHPTWPRERSASIMLAVGYGPSAVNVTSHSGVVTNDSLHLPMGSPLNLTCSADGNPKNQYGEKNTSIFLLVSQSNAQADDLGLMAFCCLCVILSILIAGAIIYLLTKRKNRSQAQTPTGPISQRTFSHQGQPQFPDEVYSVLKVSSKRTEPQMAAICTADESQLIYAEIIFPLASRNQDMTKVPAKSCRLSHIQHSTT
ncbi:hypothetical protein AAFF_G00128950 [Aldrovandia affinis]|uniref:Ig-like domain-containing protein n=1 Tax=Aldrovandia affinis TaxID=143900 RepID=A0AAD7WY65_9TELE|nr:hypothetical protein AAFF_G00128950 [Aldrovandia affinis]